MVVAFMSCSAQSLKFASSDILTQLAAVVGQLTGAEYARPLAVLSGNTIGKHVRHILEFYELLLGSTQTGCLNYDRRVRDLRLEVDPDEVLRRIGAIDRAVQRLDLNQPLQLEADLSVSGAETVRIPSSFARELHHNIEHAIHHMALIRIAVLSSCPAIGLPTHFGVAYSTLQHHHR
ncbi:DinB family protein [Larkinella soli]|uniref:DinB family protein n=1 Tax=Larkinella soli TaxID=1770527 RepID=UPI001E3099F6|nr:DinB family protein [Larkinella soli]